MLCSITASPYLVMITTPDSPKPPLGNGYHGPLVVLLSYWLGLQ